MNPVFQKRERISFFVNFFAQAPGSGGETSGQFLLRSISWYAGKKLYRKGT
jgi:hypothetical protein